MRNIRRTLRQPLPSGRGSGVWHVSAAAADDVRNYLKQKYKGEATVPVVDPDGKDASFFLQLDIDSK